MDARMEIEALDEENDKLRRSLDQIESQLQRQQRNSITHDEMSAKDAKITELKTILKQYRGRQNRHTIDQSTGQKLNAHVNEGFGERERATSTYSAGTSTYGPPSRSKTIGRINDTQGHSRHRRSRSNNLMPADFLKCYDDTSLSKQLKQINNQMHTDFVPPETTSMLVIPATPLEEKSPRNNVHFGVTPKEKSDLLDDDETDSEFSDDDNTAMSGEFLIVGRQRTMKAEELLLLAPSTPRQSVTSEMTDNSEMGGQFYIYNRQDSMLKPCSTEFNELKQYFKANSNATPADSNNNEFNKRDFSDEEGGNYLDLHKNQNAMVNMTNVQQPEDASSPPQNMKFMTGERPPKIEIESDNEPINVVIEEVSPKEESNET
eukprot:UN33174